jgi:hypothetical protein
MQQNIRLALVAYDKTESLGGIEPLDLAMHNDQRFIFF